MSNSAETQKFSWFARLWPGLTLLITAPLIAELLPGATRMSSAFVFPIEMVIWGGGAVFARYLVRKFRLGWFNLLLLALALAVAEECLIQQTSFAPLVIKLKGVEYARAAGVNYVYLLWALLYEALFVVMVPVGLCELIYPQRRENGWLSGFGMAILGVLFVPACYAAWFGWTQIARLKVFHVPAYNLPANLAIIGAVTIAVLIALAVGPLRRMLAAPAKAMTPPHPAVLFVLGLAASFVLFSLVVLSFGEWPDFPPMAAVAIALVLAAALLLTVPGWMASPRWGYWHTIAALYGMVIGNCGFMFMSFIDAAPLDFYGKAILDGVALLLMLWLMVARRPKAG